MDINFSNLFLLSVKIVLLVVLALYFIFSLVLLEKVKFLAKVLSTDVSPVLALLVFVNTLVSVFLFFTSLLIL